MTDEQKIHIVVRVYIFNKDGKLFLIKSPKEGNMFTAPGGHIEYGEKIGETVVREVKEETGLDIKNVEYVTTSESIRTEEGIHYIALRYRAEMVDDEQIPVLQAEEAADYILMLPEELLEREDVKMTVKKHIKEFFLSKKEKKGFWGSKECKDCSINTEKTEEYKKDWQRALADYKNLQKETSERRAEWAQMSKANILEDFIPVYDNFKSAFFHHPVLQADNEEHKQIKNWIDGIGFIMKQFGDVMKSHGVEEIKTVGEKFDPNMHESMGEEEVEDKEVGTILKELVSGYKMGGKVIKAAKVIIAK